MANTATTIATRFNIWLKLETLDGTLILDHIPISHLTLNFSLDGVPTAAFVIATGMDVVTGKLAAIQTVTSELDNQIAVSCYMAAQGSYNETTAWPQGKNYRIWSGISTGLNFTLNRQTLSFQLSSNHWLSLLDNSPISCENLLKGSCDCFTTDFGIQTNGGSTQSALAAVASAGGAGALNANPDFWTNIVFPMVKFLIDPKGKNIVGTSNLQLTIQALASGLCSTISPVPTNTNIDIGNADALKILTTRFNDKNNIVPGVLIGDLVNTFKGGNNEDAYLNNIANQLVANYGDSTTLIKIYSIAQTFLYNLISNVEAATFAPYVPVLCSKYIWRTIKSNEYAVVKGSNYIIPEVAGVGLYAQAYVPTNSMNGQDVPTNIADNKQILGAYKGSKRGKMLMIEAPSYLVLQNSYQGSIGQMSSKNMQLATGQPVANVLPSTITQKIMDNLQLLGCLYCKMKYFERVYSMRTATVSGKLRFDIAPGSMIKLENGAVHLPQFNTTDLYATVSGVTIIIDAQEGQAMTNLSLSHIRSAKEDFSCPTGHPFFMHTPWIGSPLVNIFPNDLTPEANNNGPNVAAWNAGAKAAIAAAAADNNSDTATAAVDTSGGQTDKFTFGGT